MPTGVDQIEPGSGEDMKFQLTRAASTSPFFLEVAATPKAPAKAKTGGKSGTTTTVMAGQVPAGWEAYTHVFL